MTKEEIYNALDEVFQEVFDDDEIHVNELLLLMILKIGIV